METEDAVAFSGPNGKWHGPVHDTRDPPHQVTAEDGELQMAVASAVSAPDCPAVAVPVQHTAILHTRPLSVSAEVGCTADDNEHKV